ncbi:glycosyltransferase family 9 protein [Halomonas sp. JS92-SW72]|uniref:glycosyltransferase family 9 protein n=1 Tax=Halomonas sp. JS92-SW72 TaxID=2306583 RepID=UPI0013C34DD8|nr:glycosyltransferase family 9 protein [Halomonas sp. JS92-SW72]
MRAWIDKCAYLSRRGRRWLESTAPNEVKRILVIRQCAFGDYMAARPFLVELRRLFPEAHITLATVTTYRYAVPEDLVDEVFVQETRGSLAEQWRSLRAIEPVDILFDLADTSRSRVLTLMAPAAIKLGFPYRGVFNHLLYDVGLRRSNYHYEAEVLLDFLKVMGHKPRYPLDFAMPLHRPTEAPRVIAYFPFASQAEKSLPLDGWGQLIDQAAQAFPTYRHVLLEGHKAEESGDFLAEVAARHANVAVQPRMSLEALGPWMAGVSALVCGDTGVRNLALATHTPTLGIFFQTLPYRYWPRYESCHEAVFLRSGEVPGSTDILQGLEELLTRVYPEREAPRQPDAGASP